MGVPGILCSRSDTWLNVHGTPRTFADAFIADRPRLECRLYNGSFSSYLDVDGFSLCFSCNGYGKARDDPRYAHCTSSNRNCHRRRKWIVWIRSWRWAGSWDCRWPWSCNHPWCCGAAVVPAPETLTTGFSPTHSRDDQQCSLENLDSLPSRILDGESSEPEQVWNPPSQRKLGQHSGQRGLHTSCTDGMHPLPLSSVPAADMPQGYESMNDLNGSGRK